MKTAEEWARALLADAEGEELWSSFAAEAFETRSDTVLALKDEVDRIVRSEPPAALLAAEVLIRASEHVPERRATALSGRAVARHFNARHEEALEDFQRARDIYAREGNILNAARIDRSLVDVLQLCGRATEALEAGVRAREVFIAQDEKVLLAQVELNMGNVHTRLDDYPAARECYVTSRDAFVELEHQVGIAFAEFNLAVVELNANRIDEAERALRVAREGMASAGMGLHVADCDYSLAYLESRRGNFEAATLGLERSAEAYAECGKPSGVPLCELDLAEIYLRLDARRDALDYAQRAAATFAELGLHYERARAEVVAGLALYRLGKQAEARAELERARERFVELGNESWAGVARLQRAAIDVESGLAREAASELEGARRLFDERAMALPGDLASLTLARARLSLGETDAALATLEELLAESGRERVRDELVIAEALRLSAEARLARGDEAAAIESLRRAVLEIESSYRDLGQSDIRLAFFRDRYPAFADLAELLARDPSPERQEEALATFERSRSRSLAEEGRADSAVDPEARRLRQRLDWLLSRRLDSQLGPVGGEHELRGGGPSQGEIEQLREEYQTHLRKVRHDERRSTDLAALGLDELRAACGERDVALVYLFASTGGRVFVLQRDSLESVPLETDEAELRGLRRRLWLQIDKLGLGRDYVERHREQLMRSVHAVLDDFGRALLEPVADRIAGRPLVIVPCGELHELPFHAFRVRGKALIEEHDVSYGLSTWHAATCRKRPSPQGGRLLASAVSGGGLSELGGELSDLQASYGAQVVVLPSGELVARLEQDPPRGGILHVAGHARHEARNPLFSGVCLGSRFLFAHDLERMHLDLHLATLSGCETGRRLRVGGEELFGLSRALLSAGARAVLGSLWAVGDREARAFMAGFYRELAAGRDARAAVGAASRELLASDGHPFAWAPFALVGNPDVRFPVLNASPC